MLGRRSLTASLAAAAAGCLLTCGAVGPAAADASPSPTPSPCLTTVTSGMGQGLFSAMDASPSPVTSAGGSTTVYITLTPKTFYNYLYPVFSLQAKAGPPTFEYEVNGGSWTSVAASYDRSGLYGGAGGDVWAAFLPEWTNLPADTVISLGVKVEFNSNMPAGSYLSWFSFVRSEICSALNLSPAPMPLSDLSYSPAAVAPVTPHTSSSTSSGSSGGSGTSGAGNVANAAGGSAATDAVAATAKASGTAAAGTKASAGPSGSSNPSAAGTAAVAGATQGTPSPSARSLTDAQPVASATSDSGTLLWLGVFGIVVLLAFGGGGAFAVRRRRLVSGAASADGIQSGSTDEAGPHEE